MYPGPKSQPLLPSCIPALFSRRRLRSTPGTKIDGAVQHTINTAVDFNRLVASLAGTQTMLVLLNGDKYPVQWPATPAAVAAADLIELGGEQHPTILGPKEGTWQLEDPRVEEGDQTLPSVRAVDLAIAIQSKAWGLDTPLMVVFDAEDDNGSDGDHGGGAPAGPAINAPGAVSFSVAIVTPLPPCDLGGL